MSGKVIEDPQKKAIADVLYSFLRKMCDGDNPAWYFSTYHLAVGAVKALWATKALPVNTIYVVAGILANAFQNCLDGKDPDAYNLGQRIYERVDTSELWSVSLRNSRQYVAEMARMLEEYRHALSWDRDMCSNRLMGYIFVGEALDLLDANQRQHGLELVEMLHKAGGLDNEIAGELLRLVA